MQPTIISDKTSYSFVEIYVDFIEKRPSSVLELVFKDEAGVKHKSTKFKEGDLLHWNLDMFVYFSASLISKTVDNSGQLRSNAHLCYIDNPAASTFQNQRGSDRDRVQAR